MQCQLSLTRLKPASVPFLILASKKQKQGKVENSSHANVRHITKIISLQWCGNNSSTIPYQVQRRRERCFVLFAFFSWVVANTA